MAIKRTTEEEARARLRDVPLENAFWCHDGQIMKNLEELAVALKQMSEDTYGYHANQEKNDFSNWITDVIGDAALANQLRKITTPSAAARKVDERLAWLKAKL